ncbi:MAG: bifunctional phosphopantothenoylcysteine decarboxylase/phosphopantothenate--cysteine ligase CoaBC [Candidatus Hydrothermarchaeales archaeon]
MEVKSEKLEGKRVALCVTGSAAAIESPKIARELSRNGADVTAYMTKASRRVIHSNAMQFATGKDVVVKLTGKLEHLKEYDLVLVAPATANSINKIACGIADTAVTSLVFSTKSPVVIAPSMHLKMYKNAILKENIEKLKRLGFSFIEPIIKEGATKLAGIEDIVDAVIFELYRKDLEGLKVLVSAGPTLEYLDPVRIITNKSSGKMGIEIAREAHFRGADVTLVYGPGTESVPIYIDVLRVETGEEMLNVVKKEIVKTDIFVSAAAVADFKVKGNNKKIDSRSGKIDITLTPTKKILDEVKDRDCFKIGFKALHDVSGKELANSAYKILKEHNLDLVVANDVSKGILGYDENEVFFVDKKKKVVHVPRTLKSKIAEKLWDSVAEELPRK